MNWQIGKLAEIKEKKFIDANGRGWNKCRIRKSNWHSWDGGKRPIPEGLTGTIRLRDKSVECLNTADKWEHDGVLTDCDIIAFWIDGTANDYKYEWEK